MAFQLLQGRKTSWPVNTGLWISKERKYGRRVNFHLIFALAVLATGSAFPTLIATNGNLFSEEAPIPPRKRRPERLTWRSSSSELARQCPQCHCHSPHLVP